MGYVVGIAARLRACWLGFAFVVCLSPSPAAEASAAAAASAPSPGSSAVAFTGSCGVGESRRFNEAVALLHSFEYAEAERLFRAVLTARPECAMARWGIAMSLWHPLWAPPGPDELEAGRTMLAGIDTAALSTRDAGFIEALQMFFDDPEAPHQVRAQRYAEHMRALYERHRDDPEVAVFQALSLLAIADPTDKTYCRQYQAAALLNWVRGSRPRHPGALHYLIHAFDYPGLAHLALDAALDYADAAPDSAHARHMPSHIFTRLGMWERAIASNRDATAAAADYTVRARLPGHYDEGVHSIDYLIYALLQIGDDAGARRLVDELEMLGKVHPETFKVAFTYASAPARVALEQRQWREASRLALGAPDFPWHDFGWARSIHHFARGLGAARSGQLDLARRELESITSIAQNLPAATLTYWREQVRVHADVVAAWIALGEGDSARALELAERAADREDAVDKHPVTPGEVLPARELLGDMLLELDRSEAALQQYRAVLNAAPGRTNALLGAARAAHRSGETAAAADYYRIVREQTQAANTTREGVQEARAYRVD